MPDIKQQFVILSPFTPMANQPHVQRLVNSLFTMNIPLHCGVVLVQALTQNIRYTTNGTNPTASSGFRLTAGNDPIAIMVTDKTTLKFVAETAGAYLEYEFGE